MIWTSSVFVLFGLMVLLYAMYANSLEDYGALVAGFIGFSFMALGAAILTVKLGMFIVDKGNLF